MGALDQFVTLVNGDDVPLDRGATLLAAALRPPVDVNAVLGQLDDLAARCDDRTFHGLREHLFGACALRGNVHDYGDPENSFLDAVVERRVGIPISLAVVVVEVGRRVGVRVDPIGMPGHFLVRDASSGVFCDPFHGGTLLDEQGCRERHDAVFAGRRTLLPDELEPVSARQVLARMLANLSQTRLAGRPQLLTSMLCMHRAIPDLGAPERLALAARLESVDHFADAGDEAERAALTLTGDARVAALATATAYRAKAN
ncbi:MAG TPA: transglutaminase-like domain-containing protein [Acidimicrobiia bacterium]